MYIFLFYFSAESQHANKTALVIAVEKKTIATKRTNVENMWQFLNKTLPIPRLR